ncbi:MULTISPECIES: 3-hydroxyacyl-CoA dehydrogenase family protein [unclassified Streptomyces]|uniref:3-hydroxyacyl-CoA dehydrogenase family protein n=1 Tax=unclassified Streptomyces TaxID=2593676 RepID=UPI000C2797D6|nr:3-hydroxyacyl-CoA dehydrogenase family protein [Streptomyces sp. CB02959]PJN42469.1 3-hydroxyacyl-CoA dehydrogenase [Streptomyces sp. CB02959]
MEDPAARLAVLGAGVMGVSITTLALGQGVPVLLVETDPQKRAGARARIERELRTAHLLGARPDVPQGQLEITDSLGDCRDADAVIEAVTEDAGLKVKALTEAGAMTGPGTVLVTNTSSIPVDELATQLPYPERLVGVHFMNPSYLIRTVEVIRGARTGEPAVEAVRRVLAALDRRGVFVGDGPGFVTSRVLHRMINDAARVVQEGRATAEDVDTLMQDCLGHRTGPLRTADLIGLDNLVDSLWVLHQRTGDEGCRPCDLLLQKVRDGEHGRKNGRGFYTYPGAVV